VVLLAVSVDRIDIGEAVAALSALRQRRFVHECLTSIVKLQACLLNDEATSAQKYSVYAIDCAPYAPTVMFVELVLVTPFLVAIPKYNRAPTLDLSEAASSKSLDKVIVSNLLRPSLLCC
jgi:hypothetical protein